jgi:hypothetical protein
LLIPTPGQAEQEYLGALHARTGRFVVQEQQGLDLGAALSALQKVPVAPAHQDQGLLDAALSDLAGILR